MATPTELAQRGVLTDLASALDRHQLPKRRMYAFPRFEEWYNTELPELVRDPRGNGDMEPADQADDLIERFLLGYSFSTDRLSKNLNPRKHGVWELKTADIRFMGWFWRRDTFIIYRAMDATLIKDLGAYAGLVEETKYHRGQLDLDPPEFIEGGYENVFLIQD